MNNIEQIENLRSSLRLHMQRVSDGYQVIAKLKVTNRKEYELLERIEKKNNRSDYLLFFFDFYEDCLYFEVPGSRAEEIKELFKCS